LLHWILQQRPCTPRPGPGGVHIWRPPEEDSSWGPGQYEVER
jgi:hypothetical protein